MKANLSLTWRGVWARAYCALVVTKTLSPMQRRAAAWRSTVVLKASMAVSGAIMLIYLLVHVYGNLKFFQGQSAFDSYLHGLSNMFYP